MDAFLNVVSLRVVREYDGRPVSEEELRRILEAGRSTGSSQNRQEWRFYVVRDREVLERLAPAVFAPGNVAMCSVAVGLATTSRSNFDVGRCAQNMMLTAWNDGIGSSPNGIKDPEGVQAVLQPSEGEKVVTILSFGYPRDAHTPRGEDVEGILRRIKRKSLEELVVWVRDSR